MISVSGVHFRCRISSNVFVVLRKESYGDWTKAPITAIKLEALSFFSSEVIFIKACFVYSPTNYFESRLLVERWGL